MATWPYDDNFTKLTDRAIKPANRQTSSAGYTMSFSSATIVKRAFTMEISYLSLAQKNAIITFFDTNQGLAFDITDPDPNNSGTYSVVFDQDELTFEYVDVAQNATPTKGEYRLKLNVREV